VLPTTSTSPNTGDKFFSFENAHHLMLFVLSQSQNTRDRPAMTTTTMMRPSLRLLVRRVTGPSLQRTTRAIPTLFRNACATTSSFRWFSDETISNKNKDDTIITPEATVTITDEADHHQQSDPSTKHLDESEFTQEVKITMPDMGESTGKLCIVSGSLGYSVMARREE
jgi:hypothetical protein